MRRVKFAILISILLIGGIVVTTLLVNLHGRKTPEQKKEVSRVPSDNAKMHLEKIQFVEDKHGQKTWELEAKSIQQYQEPNIMMVEEVKVTIYTKEGRSFVISGKEGKIYQDSKNMELTGDVTVTSSDGYRLKTQSITYHHREKKVVTSDPVEIEGEQMRLVGRGMLVDMEAQTFKILNQVKTQWKGRA